MLQIDGGNNITLTRGDTLTLTISLTKDSQPYEPTADDTIRFAVSSDYAGEYGYKLRFSKEVPKDTMTLTIPSEETRLRNGTYNYDVEVTHGDGCVDTVISAQLIIIGEVK